MQFSKFFLKRLYKNEVDSGLFQGRIHIFSITITSHQLNFWNKFNSFTIYETFMFMRKYTI